MPLQPSSNVITNLRFPHTTCHLPTGRIFISFNKTPIKNKEKNSKIQSFSAMEALNAAGLTPLSVLSERKRATTKTVSQFKNNSLNLQKESFSRTVNGGLLLLSSVMDSGLAKALTYEEALEQSTTSPTPLPEFEALDGISNFVVDNPLIIGGGIAILAFPLIVSQLFGGGKKKQWGIESAKTAYANLADDDGAELLDIRLLSELRQVGSPDIRGLKKKAVNVPYNGEDKNGFLKKLSLKIKNPENTTLFVLDKFDENSELVAELVTANGFKAAYAIKDGAEGKRGWMNSGLPWILPKKTFSFDLSNLTDTIGDAIGEGADAASVALGVAAATGLGLLAFTEVETILQLLGSAALIQIFSKKLLFAEDRKRTLQDVDEFLTTKIAPKELADEIKQIGKALLPTTVSSKTLTAPAAESSPASTESKTESVPPVNDAPAKAEAVAEPKPEINSVPKAEVQKESLPEVPRPLSPYPNYPDFKPPASPMPSQP